MCSDVGSIRTILPMLAKWYNNAKKALEKSKTNSQPHSSHSLISYILAYELVLSSIHVKNKTNFQLKIVWTIYSLEYRLHCLVLVAQKQYILVAFLTRFFTHVFCFFLSYLISIFHITAV